MKVSVYLHDEVLALLKCFGDLDTVINDILEAGSKGEFEIMDKPAAPDRDGARRIDVNVVNKDYIHLMRQFGPQSRRVSLRRLLYWFVENEVYELLGWVPEADYVTDQDKKIIKQLEKLRMIAKDVLDRSGYKYQEGLSKILGILEELKNA